MGASEEAVVRRFYEEMNNGRQNEIAGSGPAGTTPSSPGSRRPVTRSGWRR